MQEPAFHKKLWLCGLACLLSGGLAAQPDWTVNPAEFQFSMIITAQLRIGGAVDPAPGNKIAIYAGGELRGVAMPVIIAGQAYYFLTVYAHTYTSDTLRFKAYIATANAMYASPDPVVFKHNTHLGTISTPYPLNFEPIQAPQIYSSAQISFQENTCFELHDVQTLDNEDAEGNGLIYSLDGGADSDKFSIDAASGKLTWLNFNPDFEAPADTSADNVYEVKIKVADQDGYFGGQHLFITVTDNVYELFDPQIGGNPILCPGQVTTLEAGGGGQYLWNTGAATAILTNVAAGAYTVTVTNQFACSAILSIVVIDNDVDAGAVGSGQTLCPGYTDPATFTEIIAGTGIGTLSYRWESGTIDCNSGFSIIGNATAATYDPPPGLLQTTWFRRVVVSTLSGWGCEAVSDCISVNVLTTDNQAPVALCQNITVQLDGGGNAAITPGQIDKGSTDNCGLGTFSITPNSFTTADLGPNNVTLTVPDLYGNISTCTATVTVTPYNITLSGKILWEVDDLTGVKDATVQLNGPATANVLTDLLGNYSFTVGSGGTYTLGAAKQINRLNGVTSADVSRIQQHITGNFPFTDPYKLVAADVNRNNQVSSQDVSILQQAILGSPPALAIFNVFWRFPNAAISLGTPPWPQLLAGAETINLPNVSGNMPNQNFVGVKIGDVTVSYANPAAAPSAVSPLVWSVENQIPNAGQDILVTFRATHFEALSSYQFGLGFDPARLQFNGWQPEPALPLQAGNFGFTETGLGEIRTLWAQTDGVTLTAGEQVFTLKFKVLQNGVKLSEVFRLDADVLEAIAYTPDLQPQEVVLEFTETLTETHEQWTDNSLRLLQNRPNPFAGETVIGFVLPLPGETRLRVLQASGHFLAESVCNCPAGYNEARFDFGALPAGILYYELTTPFGVLTKRMIR